MSEEISARDRIKAAALARELDELAGEAKWAAWLLRPLAKALRWVAAQDDNP